MTKQEFKAKYGLRQFSRFSEAWKIAEEINLLDPIKGDSVVVAPGLQHKYTLELRSKKEG